MANPVLNENFLEQTRILEGEPMSISGSINKTLILLACALVPAIYTWSLVFNGFMDKAVGLLTIGAVVGLIVALVIIFTRGSKNVQYLAPIYAVAEGFVLGGISAFFEGAYTGIVIQAVAGTFGCLFTMLLLYKAGLIRATEKFRSVIFIATASVALIYLIQIIASLFGRGIPQIFTTSAIGIGFSVFVVVIAALNFIIDFDFIERGSEAMLEKHYEWYGAFGLMLTLVWLYLEILRLLAKLNSRN